MGSQGASLRRSVAWGTIAFGVASAIVIGLRLDQAALAVVMGAACGVGASIPTGLLVVFLLRRRDLSGGKRAASSYGRKFAQSPPVVVIAPPSVPQLAGPNAWHGGYAAQLPAQREFTVIGEEGNDDEFIYWQG